MKAGSISRRTEKFGVLQAAILALTLITAFVHLVILNGQMMALHGAPDLLFTLNGLGYLALLAALFLPIPFLQERHPLVRIALIGFTLLTILAWLVMGRPYTTLGYFTKAIEVILVILLFMDARG